MSFVAAGADDNVLVLFKHLITVEDMAVPVAAMNSLVRQLQQSGASTWMQLEQELDHTIQQLQSFSNEDLGGCARIAMTSGCDLFMKYVTRAFNLENKVCYMLSGLSHYR
jgi:translation initiation factor eIF-2B subunit alpha